MTARAAREPAPSPECSPSYAESLWHWWAKRPIPIRPEPSRVNDARSGTRAVVMYPEIKSAFPVETCSFSLRCLATTTSDETEAGEGCTEQHKRGGFRDASLWNPPRLCCSVQPSPASVSSDVVVARQRKEKLHVSTGKADLISGYITTARVPERASLTLLGSGLIGMGLLAHQCHKDSA